MDMPSIISALCHPSTLSFRAGGATMARTVGFADAMVPPGIPSSVEQTTTPISGMSTSKIRRPATIAMAKLTITTSFLLNTLRITVEANAAIIIMMVGKVEIRIATCSCPG